MTRIRTTMNAKLMTVWCTLILLGLTGAACTPDWQNVTVADYRLRSAEQPMPLTFEVTGFTVDWSASMAPPFHSEDDPKMMDRLERVVYQAFQRSGFLEEKGVEQSLGHLRVSVAIRVTRPAGSAAWQVFAGLLVAVPTLLGAPLGWIRYDSTAQYELLDRAGNVVWRTEVEDVQNHYFALYYGHGNVGEPYRKDLRALSLALVHKLASERAEIMPVLESQRDIAYSVQRIRPRGSGRLPTGLTYSVSEPARKKVTDRLKMAVMQLHDSDGVLKKKLQNQITDYLRVVAGGTGHFMVIDKSRQEKSFRKLVRASKKEAYKDCYDTSCQIPLGMAISADTLLRSSVTRFGNIYILTLELFDLAREAAIASSTSKCDGSEEGFAASVETAVEKLVEQL